MSVSIMVVEDNPSIREGYKQYLIDEAKEIFETTAYVETFADSDCAIKRLLDQTKPIFDLLFTDIDLTGSPNPDKAGVNLAKFAKKALPDVPVVGCSGYFNDVDLNPNEKEYFDKWWPKGSTFAALDTMFKDAIQLAINHKKQRNTESQSIALDPPQTNEQFESLGYRLELLHPTPNNRFTKPISIWARVSDEGCEIEVVGCPALIAWGDDLAQACEVLEELIDGYRDILNVDDEALSPSMLQARDFINKIINTKGGMV